MPTLIFDATVIVIARKFADCATQSASVTGSYAVQEGWTTRQYCKSVDTKPVVYADETVPKSIVITGPDIRNGIDSRSSVARHAFHISFEEYADQLTHASRIGNEFVDLRPLQTKNKEALLAASAK